LSNYFWSESQIATDDADYADEMGGYLGDLSTSSVSSAIQTNNR